MSAERPEALLRSALEKIVYFEARSEQLETEVRAAREDAERLRHELSSAAQREIDLRRQLAEAEVQLQRAHHDRHETGRLNDLLKRERAELLGKVLEAAQIHQSDGDPDQSAQVFDLASFISELRSEVVQLRERSQRAPGREAPVEEELVVATAPARALVAGASLRAVAPSAVESHARRFREEGRLSVSEVQAHALAQGHALQGRTEETLFGFSVRELSAPDAPARARAAERLRALAHPAAAPALATALHAERDPAAQVAMIQAFSGLARREGTHVLGPLTRSAEPDVRIAALKGLLLLSPEESAPHLTAAIRDPDPNVRRRASLLALSLRGDAALEVGQQAMGDDDPEVRTLAARVLAATFGERSRALLLFALDDRERKVRQAAADALERILGADVSFVVSLSEAQRKREIRRLASLPVDEAKVRTRLASRPQPAARAAPASPEPPAAPAPAPRLANEALGAAVLAEVRAAIRGCALAELARSLNVTAAQVEETADLLVARGQAVRRGHKLFVA